MFKLLIYAIFFYVLYRLLTGGRRKRHINADADHQRTEAGELTVHDHLVQDPVCHIYIPKRQALVLQDKDTAVFFCSEQCRKIYSDGLETHRQEHG